MCRRVGCAKFHVIMRWLAPRQCHSSPSRSPHSKELSRGNSPGHLPNPHPPQVPTASTPRPATKRRTEANSGPESLPLELVLLVCKRLNLRDRWGGQGGVWAASTPPQCGIWRLRLPPQLSSLGRLRELELGGNIRLGNALPYTWGPLGWLLSLKMLDLSHCGLEVRAGRAAALHGVRGCPLLATC